MRKAFASLGLLVLLVAGGYFVWQHRPWTQPTVPVPDTDVAKPPPPLPYPTDPVVGRLAPDFALPNLAGKSTRLSDALGHVVVVSFWATWCPLCQSQLRDLGRIAKAHQRDVVVIAVNRGEPTSILTSSLLGAALGPEVQVLRDEKDEQYARYEASGMPAMYIIDANGVIRAARSELTTFSDIEPLIAAARQPASATQ